MADLTTLDVGARAGALQAVQTAGNVARIGGAGVTGPRETPQDQAINSALANRLANQDDSIEFSLRLDAIVDQFGGFREAALATTQLRDIAETAAEADPDERDALATDFNRVLNDFDDLGTDAEIPPARNDFADVQDAVASADDVAQATEILREAERAEAEDAAQQIQTEAQADASAEEERQAQALALQIQLQLEESGLSLSLDTLRAFPFTSAELERR